MSLLNLNLNAVDVIRLCFSVGTSGRTLLSLKCLQHHLNPSASYSYRDHCRPIPLAVQVPSRGLGTLEEAGQTPRHESVKLSRQQTGKKTFHLFQRSPFLWSANAGDGSLRETKSPARRGRPQGTPAPPSIPLQQGGWLSHNPSRQLSVA